MNLVLNSLFTRSQCPQNYKSFNECFIEIQMCQFHDQPHHSLDFRRLIVAHNFPTTTFSRKWQFEHVQQTSSNFKICRLVFVCQSCTTECCSRAFFIKELSNLFVHARTCDHILINISHVASVISSFRSPWNKESS